MSHVAVFVPTFGCLLLRIHMLGSALRRAVSCVQAPAKEATALVSGLLGRGMLVILQHIA